VLSSSPTVVQDDVTIDLPAERDQIETRAQHRFVELRRHVYAEIRTAQRGSRTGGSGTGGSGTGGGGTEGGG